MFCVRYILQNDNDAIVLIYCFSNSHFSSFQFKFNLMNIVCVILLDTHILHQNKWEFMLGQIKKKSTYCEALSSILNFFP